MAFTYYVCPGSCSWIPWTNLFGYNSWDGLISPDPDGCKIQIPKPIPQPPSSTWVAA